ncbi:MAG: putative Ig domain-containing protein, partial [Prosthecobacter sp.]
INSVSTDNGIDNDNNGTQSGGLGNAVVTPLVTLAAALEPGTAGTTNSENTLDIGFRPCPAFTIAPVAFTNTQYAAFSQTLVTTGGVAPYTYSITSGTLPGGLTLSTAGVISGTTTTAAIPGTYSFTVRAADSLGCAATQAMTMNVICPPISITPTTLSSATKFSTYSQGLTATTTGATGISYSWSAAPVAPSGLAAWWPAEGSALSIGGTSNGTLDLGATTTASGAAGRAFSFDGVDDQVTVPDNVALRPTQITIEAWVNPTYTMNAFGGVVSKTSTGSWNNGYGLGQLGNDTTFGFWINNYATNRATTTLTTGVWQHVVATYDGANIRLYVNGAQRSSFAYTAAISHSTVPLEIGNAVGGNFPWKGGIDEVQIYNRALSAAEVTARYTAWTTGNDGMPQGLGLNPATGLLSAVSITSPPATYNFNVRAADPNGCFAQNAYALTVLCPAITVTPTSLANGTIGIAYSQSLSASGGTAAYTWTTVTGTWPAGLSLSSAGVVSGTPTTANGTGVSVTVRATDADGCTRDQAVNIKVCPVISLAAISSSLTVGSAYSSAATASGGTAPHTYAVSAGVLPTGLTLNTSSGAITGTPTNANSQTFSIRATDANGCNGTRAYTLAPACPAVAISPTSLSNGLVGTAYSAALSATPAASYNWSVTSGTLPAGLSLNASNGSLSGTPTTAGTQTFTVRASTAPASVPELEFSTYNIDLIPGETFNIRNYVIVKGAPNTPIDWSAVSFTYTAAGANDPPTPADWNLANFNAGTPVTVTNADATAGGNSGAGQFRIYLVRNGQPLFDDHAEIRVSSSRSSSLISAMASPLPPAACSGTRSYTLKICPVITAGAITTTGTVGTAYSQTITASGGTAPYTYTLTSGALPGGLSLSTAGVLSGTPNVEISSTVTVTATDANGCTGTRNYTLAMSCPPITLNPASLPLGLVGSAYTSTTFTATGGTAPYQYTVIAGTLPAGLTLTTAGVLSGTPTASNGAGTSITVQARDAFNCLGTRAYTIKICPVITLPVISTTINVGTAYSASVAASGGATPYVYALTSGALPTGLSLNTSTGAITGTPSNSTSATFTITATDANACVGSRAYTLAPVCPTITFTTPSLANGTLAVAYSQTVTATGGNAPYTYSLSSGTLPAGLTLNATSGVISGTPTASNGAGVSIVIVATDAFGCIGSRPYVLKVCPVISLGAISPTLVLATAYSQTVVPSGGASPYTFSVTSGTLPTGLSLNTSTGIISGTPSNLTSQTFTIAATDANGCPGTRSYTLTPVCPTITVSPATFPTGLVGSAYSQTVSASGGLSPHTFALASGTLPSGLSLNASTGAITGTPTSAGLFTFTLRANDSGGAITTPSSPNTAPLYTTSHVDAVTGTNKFFRGGQWHWFVTPGSDVHGSDVYERPTVQTYASYPEGYATAGGEYYGNLDITDGITGLDGRYA